VVIAALVLMASPVFAFGGKTAAQYEESCLKGNDNDCNTIGYMYGHGVEVQQDFDKARGIYKDSCKRGSARGCYNLGTVYDFGEGTAVNHEAAAKLYDKSCGGGEITACVNLGVLYLAGQGVDADPAKAAALFRDVCAKPTTGHSKRHWNTEVVSGGCNHLANLYERGVGVAQDLDTAIKLYQKSCDLGNNDACRNLALLRARGPDANAPAVKKTEYSGDGPTRQ